MYIMRFLAPNIAAECRPGQFLHVRPGNSHDPLLRRPLSIYDVNQQSGYISFLYKVVGSGTELLSKIKVDDFLDLMGPLGRGFSLPEKNENTVLVGGGVGIAPLLYLARALIERRCTVKVLYGAGRAEELVAIDGLRQLEIPILTATLDGSHGFRGLVTDLLADQAQPGQIDRIYSCGPEAMMASVARYAARNRIWGEVSLEEHMACGVGACLGCARRLKANDEGYVKVCKDGPVFNMDEVELEHASQEGPQLVQFAHREGKGQDGKWY